MRAIAHEDPVMCVWWATEVECVSALARLEREGALTDTATTGALERLDLLAEAGTRSSRSRLCEVPLAVSSASTPCARLTRFSWPARWSPPRASPTSLR